MLQSTTEQMIENYEKACRLMPLLESTYISGQYAECTEIAKEMIILFDYHDTYPKHALRRFIPAREYKLAFRNRTRDLERLKHYLLSKLDNLKDKELYEEEI